MEKGRLKSDPNLVWLSKKKQLGTCKGLVKRDFLAKKKPLMALVPDWKKKAGSKTSQLFGILLKGD
jgi:hypothetical protein